MSEWLPAGTLDDVWEGEMHPVSVRGTDIVLCNVGGSVYAYADRCPHLAARLSAGTLDGQVLRCVSHEWTFDAAGGRGINPETCRLQAYAVRLDGDAILVDIGGQLT